MVDTSLFETALGWLTLSFGAYQATGVLPVRHRTGSARIIVFQSFETSDGEIMVAAANDRLFARFAEAIGRPEWNSDPRFKTNALRLANKDALLPQIEAVMRTQSRADWMARLEAAGVPCAPINAFPELANEPQLEAVDILQEAPGLAKQVVALPIKFDDVRPPIRSRAPSLGEHTKRFSAGPRLAYRSVPALDLARRAKDADAAERVRFT